MSEPTRAIFITGAASGIGRATALLFRDKGWFVGAFDRDARGLATLADALDGACITRRLDVTDRADFVAAVDAFAAASGGRLDILFNNAGVGRSGAFAGNSPEGMVAVVNTNVIGVLIGIHVAIPLLRATPGSLCFSTSSSSATFGMPGIAVYSATKHAVKGLTEALAVEMKPYGVRVADVLPGLVDTPLLPRSIADHAPPGGMFRLVTPREVAETVWRAYHEDRVHWYVPPELAEFDRHATLDPEGTRDELAAGTLFAKFTQPKDPPC